MPDFPRYQSKGQLTTRQPSPEAPTDSSYQVIEKVGQVGQQVQETAVKWSNAVDTIQKTTASVNFKTGMLDILNRAQNDPNYNNSDQYFKEIEKLRTDSLKGFSSKIAESEAALEFGYDARVGQIQVDNLYKKKMIDVGQTNALKFIDLEVNNPTENSLQNIRKELSKQVAAGVFDQKAAYEYERKANDDLGVNLINKDLYLAETPEAVDEVTQKITSGQYERGGVTIDPEKKKSLLDIAERAKTNTEKKIKAQQDKAIVTNRMETITGIASGKIALDSLDIPEIATYDPQLAGTLSKVKDFMVNYNPKLGPKEQGMSGAGLVTDTQQRTMRNYAKSITDTFLQTDNKELSDFVLRELEKQGDGVNSSLKLAAFVNLAALKAKANDPATQDDGTSAERFGAIKAGVKFLQSINPYLSPVAIGEFVVKNYLSGANTEKAIMQEARNVLKDKIIDRYKSVSKLPSVPNKIVDGESSVEDLHAGISDLQGETFTGNYGDEDRE